MQDLQLQQQCDALAELVSDSIEAKLWSVSQQHYVWGLDHAGRPLPSLVPHIAIGAWLGSFDRDRTRRTLERMAASDFRSDWGVRSLSIDDPRYNPAAYQTGTVWPVWNSGVIIADYQHGRPIEAYRTWQAMIGLRWLEALGPMPEVLHGSFYKRTSDAVPHQMFSEIAIQNGFYDGLLGLQIDAITKQIRLAPTLPPEWDELVVHRIPIGAGRLDLRLERQDGVYICRLKLSSADQYRLLFEPRLSRGQQD